MNPRECVIKTLNHQKPELLPYVFYLEKNINNAVDKEMRGVHWRDSIVNFFHNVCFPLPNRETGEDGKYVDAYGTAWESGNISRLLQPAITKPSLKDLECPDVDALWEHNHEELAKHLFEYPDRYRTAGVSWGLFERSWTLRGFNNILMDMIAEPGFCEDLFEAIMNHQMKMTEYLLTLDIDAIFYSDDWGQQTGLIMGPDLWRRYLKPRKAKMIEQVHKAGKKTIMHCCGSVTEIMPEIIEIGLDCLESLQPEAMDVFELKRLYGKEIALWGGGPSQSLIHFGTPKEIRDRFQRLRAEMGIGGGYICAPAKSILDGTPVANAIATIEGIIGHDLERGY